jgi:hypothetical protein
VGEEIAQGDVRTIRAFPRRDVLADAIVQAERSPFDLLHDERGGGEHLGERGEVEDRVLGGRGRPGVVAKASKGPAPQRPGGIADFNDRRRKRPLPDGVFEYLTGQREHCRNDGLTD